MNSLTQLMAVLAGVAHMAIFALEAVLLPRRAASRLAFFGSADATSTELTLAFNQGFYNLFLAVGTIGGVVTGNSPVTLFCCACMVGAGVVLLASQRRLWRGAALQIVPAGVALLAEAI